jgi:hypothetical protein
VHFQGTAAAGVSPARQRRNRLDQPFANMHGQPTDNRQQRMQLNREAARIIFETYQSHGGYLSAPGGET